MSDEPYRRHLAGIRQIKERPPAPDQIAAQGALW
jgi:hypothetical protein